MEPKPITEHQFHMVWTEAVGMPGYDKRLFSTLLASLIGSGKVIPTDHNLPQIKKPCICRGFLRSGLCQVHGDGKLTQEVMV